MSLAGVTLGATNECFIGRPIDNLLHRLYSGRSIKIGRFKYAPPAPIQPTFHYAAIGRIEGPNQAIVWLRHRGGEDALRAFEKDSWKNLRATVSDESGEEWESPYSSGIFIPPPRPGLDVISEWHFLSFPRRGKWVEFKLYGRGASNEWNLLADFKTANPARGAYPHWEPTALPARATNGDMKVSLVGLVSGSKVVDAFPGEKRPFTMATFQVERNGRPTTSWIPERMEATDATGNEGKFNIVYLGVTNGLVFHDAQTSSLSPSEVWRLKVRFKQQSDFADAQVWTSPELSASQGIIVPTNITGRFPGFDAVVHVDCSASSMRVYVDRLPPGLVLVLGGLVDDHGRDLRRPWESEARENLFECHPELGPNTRSVRVRVAVAEFRYFEFLARPTRE